MISLDNTGRWFRCPNCLNYSTIPMECCGEMMVEEHEEDGTVEENPDDSLIINCDENNLEFEEDF